MGQYFIRTFVEGDEKAIVQLSEKAYKDFGGYTKKTPEYWRWCCLQRPNVEKKGIFLAVDKQNHEAVGYVVAGKLGSLWELSYDPNCNGEEVVSLLLDNATAYLEMVGAASIGFTAPQNDPVIKKVCMERGFTSNEPPKMFLSILDFEGLISLLANNKEKELTSRFDEKILIRLSNQPSWISDTFSIRISPEGICVKDKPQEFTLKIITDYLTFSSLLFRRTSVFGAFVRSSLVIKPLSKIFTALNLLSTLQIGADWSFQLSEYG